MIQTERKPVTPMANKPVMVVHTMANTDTGMANSDARMANTSSTYQYRDSAKRREYMRAYMAQRRA